MDHLRDSTLNVEMIALRVQLSQSQVHRLFPRADSSVMHRVWAERLEGSRRELDSNRQAPLPIAEIGWRWGFQSAAHFSRSFKDRFGQTPSGCRDAARCVAK
ncbi:MAG: helix-turn-helix transcriptional regulator [Burkholderiales bacterium]